MIKTKKELKEEFYNKFTCLVKPVAYTFTKGGKKREVEGSCEVRDSVWSWIEKALQDKEDERLRVIEKIKELIKTDGPWTSEYDGYDKAFDRGYNKCLEDVLSILKPNDGRCKCGNPKMDESDFCKDCI